MGLPLPHERNPSCPHYTHSALSCGSSSSGARAPHPRAVTEPWVLSLVNFVDLFGDQAVGLFVDSSRGFRVWRLD